MEACGSRALGEGSMTVAKSHSDDTADEVGYPMLSAVDGAAEAVHEQELFELLKCWQKVVIRPEEERARQASRKTANFSRGLDSKQYQVLKWVRRNSVEHDTELLVASGGRIGGAESSQYGRSGTGRFASWMVHPYSLKRLSWDLTSMLLVVFDMLFVPFQLFDPPDTDFQDTMSWITRCFWTCDVPFSFMSGFLANDGFIEMRPLRVARSYLRSWFLLDICIVGLDWMELLLGVSGGQAYARVGKSGRTLRILRMLRLLRMLRIWHILSVFTERLQSETLSVMTHMAKMACMIVGWAHITACVWYGIGTEKGSEDTSWLIVYEFSHLSLWYRYLTSMHWAVSQFTGGMDEITPENVRERIYGIFVFLFGFVMAAAFTSSLTSSTTRLHILTSGQSQQISKLRRYLAQNEITGKLALRIQRNAQLRLQTRIIPESSVELLAVISGPLLVELHYEQFSPTISENHPFFGKYNDNYPHIMRQICHHACSTLQVCVDDHVFNAGDFPENPKMYIVKTGRLTYLSLFGDCQETSVGTYVSEAALWVRWKHRGFLKANDHSLLLEMDAKSFQGVVNRFDHHMFNPYLYAKRYVELLTHCTVPVLDIMSLPLDQIVLDPRCSRVGATMSDDDTEGGSIQLHPVVPPSRSIPRSYSNSISQVVPDDAVSETGSPPPVHETGDKGNEKETSPSSAPQWQTSRASTQASSATPLHAS